MMRVFIGSNGLRAGWRLLIYLAIFAALAAALQITVARLFQVHRPSGPIDPWFGLLADAILLAPMMVAAFAWLSGGADGPEASILTTIALLALVPLVRLMYIPSADPQYHLR